MLFKICPRCGSKRVKWIIPQNWSTWECYDCDYTGPIIEGNEELSEEIREAYLESQKHPQENTDENAQSGKNHLCGPLRQRGLRPRGSGRGRRR